MRLARKNKIVVALSLDKEKRDKMLSEALVAAGFARIQSDARKIISRKISDVDLDTAFFVAAYDFRFNDSHVVTERLIRMSLQGIPVFISSRQVPNQFLQFCEIIYPEPI